jgi:hypothetical protein
MRWGENVTHKAVGLGINLCSDGWIHAYEHPLIAVLMNPAHGNFINPLMWEAEGDVGLRDGPLKCGVKSLTTLRQMEIPAITIEQRVRFAIACAWQFGGKEWRAWAAGWLMGNDRSAEAAWSVSAAEAAATAWSVSDIISCAEWAVTDKPISELYPI